MLALGLDAASSSLAVLLAGVAELFYHWNVRTPHWLGYFDPAPGKPLHPSSARLPSLQLLRSAALGHTLRNVRESARATHARAVSARRRAPDCRHARRHASCRTTPRQAGTGVHCGSARIMRPMNVLVLDTWRIPPGARRPHSARRIDAARRRGGVPARRCAGSELPPIRRPARVARRAARGRRAVEPRVRARRPRSASCGSRPAIARTSRPRSKRACGASRSASSPPPWARRGITSTRPMRRSSGIASPMTRGVRRDARRGHRAARRQATSGRSEPRRARRARHRERRLVEGVGRPRRPTSRFSSAAC